MMPASVSRDRSVRRISAVANRRIDENAKLRAALRKEIQAIEARLRRGGK